MTQDEIIEMARQAGLDVDGVFFSDAMYRSVLVRFAHLVAAAEREACARTLESISNAPDMQSYAKAIRARGET